MRKGRARGEKSGEMGKKKDENSGNYVIASSRPPERRPLECRTLAPILLFLVATTSLPAVYRPNDDRWNAARSCQFTCDGSVALWVFLTASLNHK